MAYVPFEKLVVSPDDLTLQMLKRFIARRNKSEFSTNLQFQIDAEACGFRVPALGNEGAATKDGYDYVWHTKHGTLREHRGKLSLEQQ